MRLFAGGVRGTRAVADAAFMAYGGDTSCYLVTGEDGEQAIVDAGTGLRSVAERLSPRGGSPVRFFFTHYHLDHLVGLPSFAPLYAEGQVVDVAAPLFEGTAPDAVIRRLFTPPLWPVPMDTLKGRMSISPLSDRTPVLRIGALELRWRPVHHPDGCVAYRFDEPASGHSVVIATDVEWALAGADERRDLLDLCASPRPARLLLVDGQFTPANYPAFRGWGHSRWTDGVEIARLAGVPALAVIHHDPGRRDPELERLDRELRASHPCAFLLRQGTDVDLSVPTPPAL